MTAEDIKDDDMDDAGSGMDDDEGARPGESEEDLKNRKRKERLEQNRISARESRKRKKTMIEELQRTVITLSRENKGLNERNETLRRQLMDIGAKVCVFHLPCRCVIKAPLVFRHLGSW
jgi:predicted RNase H-like nuclease (RuvC/YqgF family)